MKVFATLRNFATTLPVAVGRLQGFPKGVYLSVTGPLLKGDLRREYTIHSLGEHPLQAADFQSAAMQVYW